MAPWRKTSPQIGAEITQDEPGAVRSAWKQTNATPHHSPAKSHDGETSEGPSRQLQQILMGKVEPSKQNQANISRLSQYKISIPEFI